jgi:hypothetical protein
VDHSAREANKAADVGAWVPGPDSRPAVTVVGDDAGTRIPTPAMICPLATYIEALPIPGDLCQTSFKGSSVRPRRVRSDDDRGGSESGNGRAIAALSTPSQFIHRDRAFQSQEGARPLHIFKSDSLACAS